MCVLAFITTQRVKLQVSSNRFSLSRSRHAANLQQIEAVKFGMYDVTVSESQAY
jgi:hypothetical protein